MNELKWRNAHGVKLFPWEMSKNHLKQAIAHLEEAHDATAGGPFDLSPTAWVAVFKSELLRRKVEKDAKDKVRGNVTPTKRETPDIGPNVPKSVADELSGLQTILDAAGIPARMKAVAIPTDPVKRREWFASEEFYSLPRSLRKQLQQMDSNNELSSSGVNNLGIHFTD